MILSRVFGLVIMLNIVVFSEGCNKLNCNNEFLKEHMLDYRFIAPLCYSCSTNGFIVVQWYGKGSMVVCTRAEASLRKRLDRKEIEIVVYGVLGNDNWEKNKRNHNVRRGNGNVYDFAIEIDKFNVNQDLIFLQDERGRYLVQYKNTFQGLSSDIPVVPLIER